MHKTKVTLSLSPLALLTLAACGGGGSSGGSGAVTTAVAGNVHNGPLASAWAFLDLDNDGVWDDGTAADGGAVETRIRTEGTGGANGAGYYTLSTTATDYTLVAYTDGTTIDTTTNEAYGADELLPKARWAPEVFLATRKKRYCCKCTVRQFSSFPVNLSTNLNGGHSWPIKRKVYFDLMLCGG